MNLDDLRSTPFGRDHFLIIPVTLPPRKTTAVPTKTLPFPVRPIRDIAREIRVEWKNVYFGAVPYLDAMFALDSIDDHYIADDAKTIVIYFLSNATSWRGEAAKRIKAELRALAGLK